MIDVAHRLINSKLGHFQPDKFRDRYEDALRGLIAQK
jgi:non-homologous end joining protein Ku